MAEDWNARADREATRIIDAVEFHMTALVNMDYARIQQILALAWLDGYKAALSDAAAELAS